MKREALTRQIGWRSEIWVAGLLVAAPAVAYLLAPRWAIPAFVGTAIVVAFGHAAKRDPVGFGSVALPGVVLAIASGLAPRGIVAGALGGCASFYVLAFLLGENRLWAWWSRYVLRRPLPSPARLFELLMTAPVRAFFAATVDPHADAMPTDDARSQAQAARDAIVALVAPGDDWEALRAAYVAAMTDGLDWWFDAPEVGSDWQRLADPLLALSERLVELRGQEPEWIGLFPTLPKADVRHRNR